MISVKPYWLASWTRLSKWQVANPSVWLRGMSGRRHVRQVDFLSRKRHIEYMASLAKKAVRTRRSADPERTVVYHGIKIPPMMGKRSATAKAIRDALRRKSEQTRGKPAHG